MNYDTRVDELEDLFAEYGTVDSAKIITDRDTGRSKGFGFVEMPNDDEGLNAIEALNDTELDGRRIVVKKATPKSDNGGGRRGGGGYNRGGGNRRY